MFDLPAERPTSVYTIRIIPFCDMKIVQQKSPAESLDPLFSCDKKFAPGG
jgi:hypothetical protein